MSADRPTTQPLTREQIMALPDGARVVIEWDGGNARWPLQAVRGDGELYFCPRRNPRMFVGTLRDAKHVWLAEE